ncbi:MAG: NADH-quinone oxidoreductase subunit [Actinomycetota bacterium]|jgi:NADH-quinone oxidoreductase subunit C|nr:NADH-quinone oxidoreductase subunit [Actinomycetota bacterium]
MTITTVPAGEWAATAERLKNEGWQLKDLTGLDRLRLTPNEPRFEVVVQLLHHEHKERQMIHVTVEGDPPTVPSVMALWPTANFMERETFDMFGVHFTDHPNLTRILMPDEWEGHPLRKDYGVGKVPVEFIPQPLIQIDSPGQSPKSGVSGSLLDRLGQAVVEGDAP